MHKIAFVIPAYNEEDNLRPLSERIQKACAAHGIDDFQIIFVENGSSDNSMPILRELNAADPRVCALSMSRNFGPQGAIYAGLSHADAEWTCVMDGDQQDPPEFAMEMYEKTKEGYDVVYAVRESRVERPLRKIGFYAFYRVWQWAIPFSIPLDTGEFSIMHRRVVDTITSMKETFRFNRGLRTWVGFKQTGMKHHRPDRVAGEHKYTIRKDLALAMDAILSFSVIPLRFMLTVGAILSAVALLIFFIDLVAILLDWMGYSALRSALPPGLTTLNLIMLVFFGFIVFCIGVIGEYIGRIYEETKRRPGFIVREKIGKLTPIAA
jgi:dolichol-phosphate mannosyltransferase